MSAGQHSLRHASSSPWGRSRSNVPNMITDEERIALFLDYENLAIGARDQLKSIFDFTPVADALAERGRVVVRRAYADWNLFEDDRRSLVRHHVELIEMPQRMGFVRKNAADIKMAVDAMEMAFERDYVTTFVIGTGDSDFTPLVHKLRELNKKVIGVGIKASTSALLPPACDEFLFYESLEGVETPPKRSADAEADPKAEVPVVEDRSMSELAKQVGRTLSGLKRSAGGTVLGSNLKRTLLRKDPTFSEADYGFRAFGELLRHLESQGVIALSAGANGDPVVDFPSKSTPEDEAFELLATVIRKSKDDHLLLSGLKNALRKEDESFSEKKFGFSGFLQFAKAGANRGVIDLVWSDERGDYLVSLAE